MARVLEIASGSKAVAYGGALLAVLGQDVWKIEIGESGDALRDEAPKVTRDGTTVSLPMAHTSAGKRRTWLGDLSLSDCVEIIERDGSVALSMSGSGRVFAEALQWADVVVTSFPEIVGSVKGRYRVVSVTPYGFDSAKSSWTISGTTLFHVSGLGIVSPRSAYHDEVHDGPPQAPWGSPLEYLCGAYAAFSAYGLARTKPGSLADVALIDCMLPLTRREAAAWQYDGFRASRSERLWKVGPSGFYQCSDGYIYMHVVEDRQWQKLCAEVGSLDLAEDPRLRDAVGRFAHESDIDEILGPWCKSRPRAEVFGALGSAGIPCGAANSAHEARELEALVDGRVDRSPRETWVTPLPIRCEGEEPRWLGESDLASLDSSRTSSSNDITESLGRATVAKEGRPYSGLRVLEFTHVWAGPLCGQLLADAGADVVKIESHGHLDVHRRAGPYAEGTPDINASGVWNAQNRGKRSIALNLKDRQGLAIALELVSAADVVIDNFRPGVLSGLGLSHEAMLARRPGLIGVSISGFGLDEKWRNYPAYGPTMDAIAGLSAATADPLGRPQAVNGWLPDVSASLFAAVAIASALDSPSSEGRWFDINELASTLALLPEQAEVQSGSGSDDLVRSNGYPGGDICHVLPSRGEDEWVALRLPALFDERWVGAVQVVLHMSPDSDVHRSLDVASIVSVQAATEALSLLTSDLDKSDVARALQLAGYEAVPVNAAPDLLNDLELTSRDSYVVQKLPGGYELQSYGSVIRWNDEPRLARVAPQFGQHTHGVLEEWLDYSRDRLDDLEEQENLFW
jgi:crotonobetainyl-CoA:carnitine CoA-transferase CaiB-like acyl-CoA transferase